jgi:hypothetical protein
LQNQRLTSQVSSDGGHGFTGKMRMSTCALRISVISPCESTDSLNEAEAERYSLLKTLRREQFMRGVASSMISQCRTNRQTAPPLANPGALHSEQGSQFFELARDMANPNGTVVSRAVGIPFVQKVSCAEWETVSAIRIPYFENRSTH